MVCRISVLCAILFISMCVYAFDSETIRMYELRSEVQANLYAGDDVVCEGEIQNLDFRLSDFQVASMNIYELMLLRNAVFAKYGFLFKNEIIFDHFEQFEWYVPRSEDVSELISDTDQWNIDLILYYENRLESCETESPEVDEIVGFWHGNDCVGSGWSKRYFFYPDGRFVFRESQMDGAARLRELSGEWYIDGNHLVLEADSVVYNMAGEIVEPYASMGSDYVIDNGELLYSELRPHDVFRLPLESYFEGGELEGYDYPVLPNMRIGYGGYWRMSADAQSEHLQ